MLFGNAHIKKPVRESFGKAGKTGSFRHGGSDSDNPFVLFSKFQHGSSENFRVSGDAVFCLFCLAAVLCLFCLVTFTFVALTSVHIKGTYTVEIDRVFFSRRVALSLGCCDMQQYRLF